MAGEVRQQIDQASLERYLEKNVPEVKPPLSLKQVESHYFRAKRWKLVANFAISLDLVNRTQPTKSPTRPTTSLS